MEMLDFVQTRSRTVKCSLGAKTLICPTPTWIVGSYDKQGKPNGMTAAWGGSAAPTRLAWRFCRGRQCERRAS
jgi:flavin reductase (DIM6/NTAB) family NADH-FMN oxidoreductase RutF